MPNEVSANQVFSTNQVLANEVLAPLPEVALSEPDYRAFCAALEASARGRAFLTEYARRNRQADTATVLAALDRLETLVRSQSATAEADRIRQELRALLAAMRGAQPVIDASAAAIKAAKLAGLIGFVQHRIESIVAPTRAPSALPPEVAALVLMNEAAVEAVRSHLVVVPRADEPELPIPARTAGSALPIALVQDQAITQPEPEITPPAQEVTPPVQEVTPPAQDVTQRSVAIIPEVNLFDGAPANPAAVEPAVAEPAVVATVVTEIAAVEIAVEIAAAPPPAVFELTLPPPAVKRPTAPPVDPLAHIMALSDEERIALFS